MLLQKYEYVSPPEAGVQQIIDMAVDALCLLSLGMPIPSLPAAHAACKHLSPGIEGGTSNDCDCIQQWMNRAQQDSHCFFNWQYYSQVKTVACI